jgi:hypothetical protein
MRTNDRLAPSVRRSFYFDSNMPDDEKHASLPHGARRNALRISSRKKERIERKNYGNGVTQSLPLGYRIASLTAVRIQRCRRRGGSLPISLASAASHYCDTITGSPFASCTKATRARAPRVLLTSRATSTTDLSLKASAARPSATATS